MPLLQTVEVNVPRVTLALARCDLQHSRGAEHGTRSRYYTEYVSACINYRCKKSAFSTMSYDSRGS